MEPGFWSDYRATFRGRYGWTMVYSTAWGVMLTAALVWLVVRLFEAESTRDLVLLGTLTVCVVLWLALVKAWAWIQITYVRIVRRLDEAARAR